MQNKLFPFVESFLSVQGEGLNSGKYALFIRFGDCNIRCEFCDSKEAWNNYKLLTEEEIKKILKRNRTKTNFLILTGGEPALYNLSNIVKYAKKLKYFIALETNGTIFKDWMKEIDWITLSPKKDDVNENVLKIAKELKFVIINKKSFNLVEKFLPFDNVVLQPVNNRIDIAKMIIKKIAKSKYKSCLRLGLQLHKIIGIK